MSGNQTRGERSEGQLRRAGGRSGSYAQNHHRGLPAKGGAATALPPPSSSSSSSAAAPPPGPQNLSSNRSFKKSSNGQGGQPRVSTVNPEPSGSVAAAGRAAIQNGGLPLAQAALHGPADAPMPGGAKPADASTQRSSSSRPVPKAPPPHPAAVASNAAVPTTPAKGDASKQFDLQFGTISPGIMNGMQIPARTSSAPPNLDEQKRDQARHDSFRGVPTLPIPSAPKAQPQQARRDVGGVNQSHPAVPLPPTQTKRDVQAQIPAGPAAPTAVVPKSSVLSMPGMSMPMPFQQSQITLQFSAPGPQMQSQGVTASSLQMPMTLPGGNASQVPPQMFLSLQSHPLQQQAMMHQGQGLGFAQMGHQLPPQLGNMGIAIAQQFPQQQPGKFGGQRKTTPVKITHPDTHEELRLDKRPDTYPDTGASGQRPLPSLVSQSQTGPNFNVGQINYYTPLQPNSYSASPMFYTNPTSLPMNSTQMTSGPQPPRYSYPVSQSGPPISFMNHSVLNPMTGSKSVSPPLHGVSEAVNMEPLPLSAPTAPIQVTVKPSVASTVDKLETPLVTISMPASKAEAGKLVKPSEEASLVDKFATSSVIVSMPVAKDGAPKSIKPLGDTSVIDKIGRPPLTIGKPLSKDEEPKTRKPPGLAGIHQQKDGEIALKSSVQQTQSISEPSGTSSLPSADRHPCGASSVLAMPIMQPETYSSASVTLVGDSGTSVSGTDGRKREPIQRSDSLKDHQKKPIKKDTRHSQQLHQPDASGSVGSTKLPTSKTIKDDTVAAAIMQEGFKSPENDQVLSGAAASASAIMKEGCKSPEHDQVLSGADAYASTINSSSPNIEHHISSRDGASETANDDGKLSVSDTPGVALEKEALQDVSASHSDAVEIVKSEVPMTANGPFETSAISAPQVVETMLENIDSHLCPVDHISVKVGHIKEILAVAEHGKSEVSIDLSQDSRSDKICSVSSVMESSEVKSDTSRNLEQIDAELPETVTVSEIKDSERQQLDTSNKEDGCILEVDSKGEVQGKDDTISSDFTNAESEPSSRPQSGSADEDKPSSSHPITNRSKTVGSGDNIISSDFVSAEAEPSIRPQSASADEDKRSSSQAITNRNETVGSWVDVLTDLGVSQQETASVPASASCGTAQKLEGKAAEVCTGGPFSGPKDKSSLEATRVKPTTGRKKNRREILSKADAAGTSDLYNAYKGPVEKPKAVDTPKSTDSSLPVNAKPVPVNVPDKAAVASEEDGQGRTEVDDWEDAADISTPKLRMSDHGQHIHGMKKHRENENEALGRKKYSRDFLLTFSEQCRDLPLGFEIGADIVDALMNAPLGATYVVDREPYPSPGRMIDRSPGALRADRRTASTVDDDKWSRAPGSFGPGRDFRLDMGHAAAPVSFRAGQGVSQGVLRNPRGQSSTGGILSGPMQSLPSQGGAQRHGADADRWQRGTGIQRGLIPSPQTPAQVMHKAAKKYEIGKVSDQEESKQRQLKGILNKLTPQNFEKLCAQVKEVNIDNAGTLTGVISQIFDKALMEPTFCEMYANFCSDLAGSLPDFSEDNEKITFKRLLLNKCQEEFERGEREQAEASKAEEEGEVKQSEEAREEKRLKARRRMLGNIRLIGELYKKRMLTERIMHECIKKLLGQYQNPDEEDIEALCKLMSTIGEMIDHSKAKEHMDAYFDAMQKLSTNQKLSSRVRFMLKDAIELRKNKWLQRRKVEGPKKIEEVHRDAAQERQAQASRMGRGPVMSSSTRRGPPLDYGPRGSSVLPSPGSQQIGVARSFPTQVRGSQDVRLEARHLSESRMLSVPLPPRTAGDDSITLGPQGGLARGMSIRGQPLMSNVPLAEVSPGIGDPRRVVSGQNGHSSVPDWTPYSSREEITPRHMSDRFAGAPPDQPSLQDRISSSGSRDPRIVDRISERSSSATFSAGRAQGSTTGSQTATSEARPLSEEVLREKSMSAIREFYSAKDEDEVALCIRELNSPSFYPAMVSLWVTDSFERKDMERDLLTRLLVNLSKCRNSLFSQVQLIQGFESVLSSLEDAMNDAPRAAEFLGWMLSKIILENVVPFREIGRLIHEGGEEPGRLLEIGLAADVLGSILEVIQVEKGDSELNEICANSNLQLEDFRPPHPLKSRKLDAFL